MLISFVLSTSKPINCWSMTKQTESTGATTLTALLLPPADYLPEGKQGWIFAFIVPPPGQSVTTARSEFASPVVERLAPYIEEDAELKINNYFMGMFGNFAFAGARMENPDEADALIDKLNSEILSGFPRVPITDSGESPNMILRLDTNAVSLMSFSVAGPVT